MKVYRWFGGEKVLVLNMPAVKAGEARLQRRKDEILKQRAIGGEIRVSGRTDAPKHEDKISDPKEACSRNQNLSSVRNPKRVR